MRLTQVKGHDVKIYTNIALSCKISASYRYLEKNGVIAILPINSMRVDDHTTVIIQVIGSHFSALNSVASIRIFFSAL